MLFHALSGAEPGVDLLQVTAELDEELDADLLLEAWQRVVARHPALRTSFRLQESGPPLQIVHRDVNLPVARHDWREVDEQEERWRSLLENDRHRGFDLLQPPLTRLTLVTFEDRRHRLLWSLHHTIMDARAFPLVLEEVFASYDAARDGRQIELPRSRPFGDYIRWLRGLDLGPAEAYWRETLRGFSAPTPLGLAPPSGETEPSGLGVQEARLSAELTERLSAFARTNDVSLGNLVQGAWALLLHRYSRERDIVFGATRTLRRSGPEGSDQMVGLLINTLPVRVTVDPDQPLAAWLRALREAQHPLRQHEHTPLVRILGWSDVRAGTPLFDTIVVFDRARLDNTMRRRKGNWKTRRFEWAGQTNFAVTLLGWEESELLLRLEHYRQVLDEAAARRMMGHLCRLLEAMPESADRPVGTLSLLSGQEREQVVAVWNRTAADYPRHVPLAELVEAQAERTPDAVAVVHAGRSLTFAQLNARANQLAHALLSHGVVPDRVVGICVERSVDMVVGLLAIVKTGAAYLPLDPLLPPERLTYMLEDSGAMLMVTQTSLRPSLPLFGGTVMTLDDRSWENGPRHNPAVPVEPDHLGYVIYTSGSTGKPKGVAVPRGALTNLLWSMRDWLGLGAQDRLLAVTTISFDIAGVDLWLPLVVGARIVVANREEAADGARLRELLDQHDITFLQATPVTWRLLLAAGWQGKPDLQTVCTGEAMPRDLAGELAPIVRRLWNLYGPTETTIWSTGYLVRDGSGPILIGRPVANTQCYVLDENHQPVPIGVVGELYLGGDGVARGYLGQPELTAEKFLPDRFRPQPGARLYRTGDLARYRPDGNLECLGRTDHQVKIRGVRIELGEIEAVIGRHPSIRETAVVVREDEPGERTLVAYLVPRSDAKGLAASLREQLRSKLPEYMVPAAFVMLERLPLTPSGKLDRRALPAAKRGRERPASEYVAPRSLKAESASPGPEQPDPPEPARREALTPARDVIATRHPNAEVLEPLRVLLSNISGYPPGTIDASHSFLELGFDSLLLTQVGAEVQRAFGVSVSLRQLLQEYTTLEALARHVRTTLDAAAHQPSSELQAAARNRRARLDPTAPPLPGARLGRDAQGNPSWFVPDPNRPGKHLQVKT
jgi:amino acid adenylation domain-containing protein